MLSLPQINQHGLDIVGRQYHILGCLNHRITCINFWHIVCITSWFQGTHNMFGFYTAFVVNVIKCRSKYKKYSKRIPTSKTGKMRKIPGQGQHWQQRLSLGGISPKTTGLSLILLVSPSQSKHWFFVFWSLPISQSFMKKDFV